jgi:hypothetical protein
VPGFDSKPTLIVFSGGMRNTAVERMVAGARDAAALDTLASGLATGAFARALLVTDNNALAAKVPAGVDVDLDDGRFSFGPRLRRLVAEREIRRPFYVGGGSIPLLSGAELAALAERLTAAEETVISNNFYSADFVAWTPGNAIESLPEIPSDNRLPQLFHAEAGLPHWETERTIASQFDIDTPNDLAVLKLYLGGGPYLRRYIDAQEIDLARYELAMAQFLIPGGMVLVAGRVGSSTWQYLERETACRIRVLSEERGMQADGREQSGSVRSVLGYYLERAGAAGLFQMLAELGDGVFFDTRVLLAHARVDASRADRFLSDLGRWQEIENPFLREFTRASGDVAVPIVLGGHSLVAGGIMALVQAAWEAHDRTALGRLGVRTSDGAAPQP